MINRKIFSKFGPWHTSSRGVPQGSASCSLNHHLHADNTQLFLSFLPTDIDSSIDHLHNALDRMSFWLTANLLRLNFSKTEFLFIGFSKQLAKINNSSLNTTHSARNLGFIFDEHITFSDQICLQILLLPYSSASLYPSTPRFKNAITTSVVHSKLDYCNSFITTCPSLRSPGSNRPRTFLHVLLSKLLNLVTSLPSFGLCTG